MKRRNSEICLVFILISANFQGMMGCADMPHTNPLDPENPDYQPPPEKKLWFTSIALQDDTVWFGSNDGGLVAFDGKQWRTYTMNDGLPDNRIQAIAAQGLNIWFTTYQTRENIVKFDGTTALEYPIYTPIVSMAADEDSLWIGGDFEIGTYDKNADSFVWYQLSSEGQLKSLLWDGANVWLSVGWKEKILRYTPKNNEWKDFGNFTHLKDESLMAIALDGDVLWGGTSRGAIRQFNLGEQAASRTLVGIQSLKSSGCIAVNDDYVWFGFPKGGLIRYDKISGERESFQSGKTIYGIAITAEHVWVATNSGAARYEKKSNTWTQYKYPVE